MTLHPPPSRGPPRYSRTQSSRTYKGRSRKPRAGESWRSNLLANFPLTHPLTAHCQTVGPPAAALTDAVSYQLLRLPGQLAGDGGQGGDVDGHDVCGVTEVLTWSAGSVHRLSVALPVTGAVTAGETGDTCIRNKINIQYKNKQIQIY